MSNLPFAQPVAPTEFQPSDVLQPTVVGVEPDPNNIQTMCDRCSQTDNHPKHQIMVGSAKAFESEVFHPDDHDLDGVIQYHFDCDTPWHSKVHAAYHAELAALANSGVKGDALRAAIPEVWARYFTPSIGAGN